MEMFKSDLSGNEFEGNQKVSAIEIKPSILKKIKEDHPQFNESCFLSLSELNPYRNQYIESTLRQEVGTLSELEKEVIEALHKNQTISDNVDQSVEENLTYGQRLADKIASFGGSWTFIISFFIVLFSWIGLNIFFFTRPFDPFSFILLNLILSCLAALQAPVIMMSQNRQEEKDRERSKHDYQVNLKAELEIRMLHEKMDHLILNQQQRLFEIQQIQIDMLKEISDKLRSGSVKVKDLKIVFKKGSKKQAFPFWNAINGPISDALWHIGQVVTFRRSSGNPFSSKVDVFMGKFND